MGNDSSSSKTQRMDLLVPAADAERAGTLLAPTSLYANPGGASGRREAMAAPRAAGPRPGRAVPPLAATPIGPESFNPAARGFFLALVWLAVLVLAAVVVMAILG
jgi:hypothetical protein